jgi:hypothetical protein
MSQVAVNWMRSSFCADNTCVEVAVLDGYVLVRDGKRADHHPYLRFSMTEWERFCVGVRSSEFSFE